MVNLIRVKNLNFKFEDKFLFKNLSFDIKENNFYLITGGNGKGKTTLLRLLSGIFPSDNIKLKKDLKIVTIISLRSVFYNLLTVEENIRLYTSLFNFNFNFNLDVFFETSKLNRDILSEPFFHLSDGQRLRVAFALVFQRINHADILIMDEWLSVGDPDYRKHTSNLMLELVKNNKTIICSSNNINIPIYKNSTRIDLDKISLANRQ